MASADRDDEGFPSFGPDNEIDTYTDEFEVTYVCENVDGLGSRWRQIGRSERPVDGRVIDAGDTFVTLSE